MDLKPYSRREVATFAWVISFSGFYGGLTDKNNPALDPTGLYRFPEGTSPMGRTPYLEASVGLENIFKDITDRLLPPVDVSGPTEYQEGGRAYSAEVLLLRVDS